MHDEQDFSSLRSFEMTLAESEKRPDASGRFSFYKTPWDVILSLSKDARRE